MSIKEQIEAEFRKARLERDEATKNVIGMLKNKVLMELKSGSGAVEDDMMWLRNVEAYAKQLRKAMAEFEALGDKAIAQLAEAKFELDFCEKFMPKRLDAEATDALVRKVATESGVSDAKQKGKLIGLIMKNHKDQVDGDLVRQAVDKLFAGN
jgi:uncharacterized protein YqeY